MTFQYYQDIRLFPDCEVGIKEIGEKLFSLLHDKFVRMRDEEGITGYALSFPEYSKGGAGTFGRYFRVFSIFKENLEALNLAKLCDKLSGYAECSPVSLVPETKSFLKFSRVQQKGSPERLARRMSKRKGISIEEARDVYKDFLPRSNGRCPSFNLKSSSTGQYFLLIINCTVEKTESGTGFNLYGLSIGGNVPDF